MERMANKVTDQEAAEAFKKLSIYCEDTQCSKCIFRVLDGWNSDRTARYTCILEDSHPYRLRVVTTNGELRVVTEEEALNNEN